MPQTGTNSAAELEQHVSEFSREWYDMMVRIWKDRIQLHGAIDTGALLQSVSGGGMSQSGLSLTAAFRFLSYGIYVDAGTGNGYERGNSGDLHFLDKAYRREHNMGKPCQRRPWFSRSWYISRRVMADRMHDIIGDAFVGLFDNLET